MSKRLFVIMAVALMAVSAYAYKKVNGRVIPESGDFASLGGSFQDAVVKWDSLNTETANILSSVKGGDAIDVNKVVADSIMEIDLMRGNPNLDSISGLNVMRGNPDIDSISGLTAVGGPVRFARSIRLSSTAGDTVTTIERLANGGGADSIRITIGGVALKFAANVEN